MSGDTPARFRKPATRSRREYLDEPRYADADLKRGALLSLACKACHVMKPGEPSSDKAPNLYGVFGRRAGSRADFDYSAALSSSDIIWTPAAVEAWIAGPAAMVPGTKMKFPGFQSAAARRDVVAYLLHHLGPVHSAKPLQGQDTSSR